MHPAEGIFSTFDGLNLFERSWRTEAASRGAVVLVHGFGEHSGRYLHVADELVRSGYSVYMFDLRGHGRSEGPRAFVRFFDEYISDLEIFIKRVQVLEEGKPVFLIGHSMGGAIGALFARAHQDNIKGLILSAPLVKVPGNMPQVFVSVLCFLSRVLPGVRVVEKVDSTFVSRDKEVVERYDSDPLVYHKRISARTAHEIENAIKRIRDSAGAISIPVFLLHGTADKIADIKGTEEFYQSVSSRDKELKKYEGLYHEIMNEPEKDKVLSDIVSWMDQRR